MTLIEQVIMLLSILLIVATVVYCVATFNKYSPKVRFNASLSVLILSILLAIGDYVSSKNVTVIWIITILAWAYVVYSNWTTMNKSN